MATIFFKCNWLVLTVLTTSFAFGQKTGTWNEIITVNNPTQGTQQREIFYNVPANYSTSTPHKLIIALGGQGQKPDEFIAPSTWQQTAHFYMNGNYGKVILMSAADAPVGVQYPAPSSYWYPPGEEDGLFPAMIERAKQLYNIDEDEVYITGFSFGGKGAYIYGLKHADLFKGMLLFTPGIQSTNELSNTSIYYYQNANKIPACFTVGTSDPFGYAQTVPAAYNKFVNEGGKGKLHEIQGMSHYLPAESYVKDCWNFIQKNTSVPALDAAVDGISLPADNGFICDATAAPKITIKNKGQTTLTKLTITYQLDNGSVQGYNWTGSLAQGSNQVVTLPGLTVPAGSHSLKICTKSPNGGVDAVTGNDCKEVSFSASGGNAKFLPFSEGFEGSFPPSGWGLNNIDGAKTWEKTNKAAKTGTYCAYINDYDYQTNGQIDELTTPVLDLSGAKDLTFDYALALYETGNPKFEVLISTDCGLSYKSLFSATGSQLATDAPTGDKEFIPTQATQWKNVKINMSAYAAVKKAIIKFKFTQDFENNFYLDNINISGDSHVEEMNSISNSLQVFPNPTTGTFSVGLNDLPEGDVTISIYDVVGKLISQFQEKPGYSYTVDLSRQEEGSYFVQIQDDREIVTRKIVLAH